MRHSAILLGIWVGLCCLPATAADTTSAGPVKLTELSLEELSAIEVDTVYGASKHAQKISEAPAGVSILTQDDFKKFGYRTLVDALRSVPGFYTTYDRAYSSIGLRGENWVGSFGGRTLLLVNGHRLSDPVYDSAFTGNDFPLDVDLIERVEVVRGPGFSLYGNNAFLAVINVITRRGRNLDGVEASGAAASYDSYRGRLSYGREFPNGLEVLASGTLLDRGGVERLHYPQFSDINNGVAEGCDGEDARQAFLSVAYGDLTLTGLWGRRAKHMPTGQYFTVFNDDRLWMADERAFLEIKYNHEFDQDWRLVARVYVDNYQFDGEYPYYATEPPDSAATYLNVDKTQASWWGGEASVSKVLLNRHRLILGTEFNVDLKLRQENFDREPSFTYVDARGRANNIGVYLQDEFSVRTNLILNVAGRYDWFETFGDKWNGRGGLIYGPFSSTTFKLIAGQGYRAPNSFELDYISPGYLSNPDLQPEQIQSYEFIWEQALSRRLRSAVSLFHHQLEDLIVQRVEGTNLIFRNAESAYVRGVECELSGQWESGLRGRVSYTFAEGYENAADGTRQWLRNSPRHLAQASVSVPVWRDKIFASLEAQAMSQRATVQNTAVPGYAVLNGTLFTRELLPGLEASVSIYNLLDHHYRDPVNGDFVQDAIEQDGRTFRVKVTYRF